MQLSDDDDNIGPKFNKNWQSIQIKKWLEVGLYVYSQNLTIYSTDYGKTFEVLKRSNTWLPFLKTEDTKNLESFMLTLQS